MSDDLDMARFVQLVKFDMLLAGLYSDLVSITPDHEYESRRVTFILKDGTRGAAVYDPESPGGIRWDDLNEEPAATE